MIVRLLAVTTALAGLASPAAADVLTMRAELHGGGAGGAGVAGGAKDHAFAEGARGGTYGALVGAEVLFLDGWIEHHQYIDGGLSGTWTQIMLGFDVDIDVGKGAPPAGAKKGAKGPPPKGYVELGLGAGFGFGTGQQVTLPIDNAQLTDKGFLIEARVAGGWNLNRIISLGFAVPVSYGYYFKSGPGVVANDDDNRYQQIQAAAMVNLRFRFKVK
jgi:hypothetical protein